jgi:ClpP class serine protease
MLRKSSCRSDAAGVKIYAYVDGMAASAGYALASAAHEVIMNPDAECGSIGVVVRLVNQNKRLEEEGITVKYITAGASKVPFADDGTYRPDYISDIQIKIDSLYTNFVEHVADMRNISADVVRGTDAKMFTSSDCLRLGLVDKVMEGEEFYTYLSETPETEINADSLSPPPKEDTVNIKPNSNIITQQKDTELMTAELQVDPSEFAKLKAQMEKQSAMLAAYAAKETQLATEKLSAQLDTTPFLANCKESLLSFFMSSDVNEDHKSLMNSVIAAAQASNEATMAEAVAIGVEAQTKVDTAEAEKEAIKKEFGVKVSSDASPEFNKEDLAAVLKANIAKTKANK